MNRLLSDLVVRWNRFAILLSVLMTLGIGQAHSQCEEGDDPNCNITFFEFANSNCCATQIIPIEEAVCNNNPYVLVHELNYNSTFLDQNLWNLVNPPGSMQGWANIEYNTLDNLRFDNGLLNFDLKEDPLFASAVPWIDPHEILSDGVQNHRYYTYTGTQIRTNRLFDYGVLEMRCKIPTGKGVAPGFWMFNGGWMSDYDELDVFEFWGQSSGGNCDYDYSQMSKHYSMTLHHADFPEDWTDQAANEYIKPHAGHAEVANVDLSQDFHIYTVEWTPYFTKFFRDGNQIGPTFFKFFNTLGQGINCSSFQPFQQLIKREAYPENPMRLIVGLGAQGGCLGIDPNTPLPATMEVDYIRYYQRPECVGHAVYNTVQELGLSDQMYNVIVGTTIELGGDIHLQPGQQLEVIASESVILNPGFSDNTGGSFKYRIDPSACVGSGRLASPDLSFVEDPESSGRTSEAIWSIQVSPNPNNGEFAIEADNLQSVEVFKPNGVKVYSSRVQGPKLRLSGLPSGMYIVTGSNSKGEMDHKKVVVTN